MVISGGQSLFFNCPHFRGSSNLWLAVSRLTHQVLGFEIGNRSTKTLQVLWRSLPPPYRRKLVYTDGYEAYAEHFTSWQHRPCEKGSGKTSVIEGLNNKWRNRVSGLVRKPFACKASMICKDACGSSSKSTTKSACNN